MKKEYGKRERESFCVLDGCRALGIRYFRPHSVCSHSSPAPPFSTNSVNVPPDWNQKEARAFLFHATPEKCCQSLLNGGYSTCSWVDVCDTTTDAITVSSTTTTTSTTTSSNSMVIQSSDVDLGGLVFYPDIQVGLCRADGLHGDINEAFLSETAEECVSSELAF